MKRVAYYSNKPVLSLEKKGQGARFNSRRKSLCARRVKLYDECGELLKNALRLVFFSVFIFIDFIAIPHALSITTSFTDRIYGANVQAHPSALAGPAWVVPEEVHNVVTELVDSFKRAHPNDIITSDSHLVGYAFRNDSWTEGYTWKNVPVYAVLIYRTYASLSSGFIGALSWIVPLNISILLIIVDPDILEEVSHAYDRLEAEQSPLISARCRY